MNGNQNMENSGSKLKTILLVALFIFLFAFIWGMPYIEEGIDNFKKETGMSSIERQAKQIEKAQNQSEKTKENTNTKVKEKMDVLTCTKAAEAKSDYDEAVVETFSYNAKKQIKESSVKTTYTFVEQNSKYDSLKNDCNENSLKYVGKDGYETACSYSDTEVVIESVFDLSTFKTIKDKTTVIEANAKLNDNIDTVKARLVSQGYTCG